LNDEFGQTTRSDAVRREAADEVRTHLELIEHTKVAVADLVEKPALQVKQPDDLGDQRSVVFSVNLALEINDVSSNAGKILLEID